MLPTLRQLQYLKLLAEHGRELFALARERGIAVGVAAA